MFGNNQRPVASPLGSSTQNVCIGGLTDQAPRLRTHQEQPVHIIVDDSYSMSDGKAQEATLAVAALLSELADPANKDGFRVTLIRFGSSFMVEASAQAPETINAAFNGKSGGTHGAKPLHAALQAEQNFVARPERRRVPGVVVFMSDGELCDDSQALREADALKQIGVTIIAIGFGADADEALLKRIATSPQHYAFASVGSLAGIFAKVGKTISQSLTKCT